MTAIWISIIGMWFCIGMAFFAIKRSKNKNRTRIYAEKIY
jgi:hypothetical protein